MKPEAQPDYAKGGPLVPELIGLDFETYGSVDLTKHGLVRYTDDATFTPLIGSVAYRVTNRSTQIFKNTFDFVNDRRASRRDLEDVIGSKKICAHNAQFEERVLSVLGLNYPASRFIDSAVVARAAGAGSKLEAAAPQLLGIDKLKDGKDLIKLFSIPGPYQEQLAEPLFNSQVISDHPDKWQLFREYCELDAELSLRIVEGWQQLLTNKEHFYSAITMEMNRTGWCVDIPLVEEMQRRYQANQAQALADFRKQCKADELNLNSLKQLKEWCADRGVRATSFDEKNVERLLKKINEKLITMSSDDPKYHGYSEVKVLLETKQILGGSSLKKLQVILDTAQADSSHPGTYRLYDQYLHIGASQSYRTTGRSVQMQNLKRLGDNPADMSELDNPDTEWDNEELARNLRQVFTASDPHGVLIVGDFSSVESRGLAWLAGEEWKLQAYRDGKDMYKVLASSPEMFGVPYDQVTKEQRQTGKVGELACGYGAGAGAVKDFAAGMGVTMTEAEAGTLVVNWRAANPAIVGLWEDLHQGLTKVVENVSTYERHLADGFRLQMFQTTPPASLLRQHPGIASVVMQITDNLGEVFMLRIFHGVYFRGRDICYYKPSELKKGDLWRSHYVNPKTKQVEFYKLYGGKLAGILTQSFCRELFFQSLRQVSEWCRIHSQMKLVGQFHDEIVVDWKPGSLSLDDAEATIEWIMSDPGKVRSFPLAAEIKHDYRYTK